MESFAGPPVEEVSRLQRCLNDLIGILAFTAMWSGRGAAEIVHSFLDGVLRILSLDVIYVRLIDESGTQTENLRLRHDAEETLGGVRKIFATLGNDVSSWPRRIPLGANDVALSIEPVGLGLDTAKGVVVAGALRAWFPQQTDRLLLNVAANQLMLALQEVYLRLNSALQKSESRLRQVIDTIPNIAWCNLTTGPNEYLNRAWYQYTGLTVDESQGWGWTVAMHPEDLPPLMKRWSELLATGEAGEIEGRFRRHDGVYRWFLIRAEPFRDETGQIVRWYGTSTDIDDRKRAEVALLASQREFIQMVNAVPALVWSARPDGSADYFSDSYLAYVGMTSEQLLPWGWMEIIHPDDLQRLVGVWEAIRGAPRLAEIEARLRRADGAYHWFLFRAKPVFDDAGNVVKWYGINTDIDDRKRTEEALSAARAELANVTRMTSLGVLTAAIAHEVNQPISGIITNASTCLRMLSAQPANIEGALETARRTIRDGNRASQVISRLRSLYTRKGVEPEPMDLNEAAREVISLSLAELQRQGVVLRNELAPTLSAVNGDRIQLQQVILNLLRNASDAMRDIIDRPRHLVIRTEEDEAGVRLSVTDTGVGLGSRNADKMFEPFQTTKSDGMGIGLSVSRSIIEAHRGRLWCTPNDGPGVTFAFCLPRLSSA